VDILLPPSPPILRDKSDQAADNGVWLATTVWRELAVALNSAVEHGRNELGPEVLLAISREFGKSLEWLLTGEE